LSFNGNNVVNRGLAVTPEICNLREQHASLYRRREGGEKIWVKDKHQTLPWPTPTSGWRTRTHLSWQIVTIAASQTISDLTMPPCIPRNLRRINRSVGQKKHGGRNEHCQQLEKGKIPKDFTFQQQHDWGHVWLDNCKYIQCFTVANCSLQTIDVEHYTGSLAQNKASILTKRTPPTYLCITSPDRTLWTSTVRSDDALYRKHPFNCQTTCACQRVCKMQKRVTWLAQNNQSASVSHS